MSLKSPQRNTLLPLVAQKRLTEMYAREMGFSGPQILDFFSQYSVEIESYPWQGGAPSRWQMFEDCLARFDLDQQKRIISDLLEYEGPMSHNRPKQEDIDWIRNWLGEGPTPLAPVPKAAATLNWTTVNREWGKAVERLHEDPAAAITSARSLLESVCIHVLEERGEVADRGGDLQQLYRAASRLLGLSPDQQAEDVFRQVMGGCATIANGLAAMRNKFSDAHGRGGADAEAAARHARLAVNAACTVALFLIESHLATGK